MAPSLFKMKSQAKQTLEHFIAAKIGQSASIHIQTSYTFSKAS